MKADRLLLIGVTMVLLVAAFPATPVAAHYCRAVLPGAGPACAVPCPQDGNFHDHENVYLLPPDGPGREGCTVFLDLCTPEPIHTYGSGSSVGGRSATVTGGDDFGVGVVTVTDTNEADCNGDGVPGDWDGDYDAGVGGGAFGWGPWADEEICNNGFNVHGPNVVVNDWVFGHEVGFVVGEDDQAGPVIVTDPETGATVCETDGSISPGDPSSDPTADADDCLSDHFVGTGWTCGQGGGDGLFWVFLDGLFVDEAGSVTAGNPATAGTLTAF